MFGKFKKYSEKIKNLRQKLHTNYKNKNIKKIKKNKLLNNPLQVSGCCMSNLNTNKVS